MEKIAYRLASFTAIVGGVTLAILIILTCLSISGRALVWMGLGPIPGDYELVEAGVAFAIFCFIPVCQINAGHATVDVFTSLGSDKFNRFLIAMWEVLFAVVLVVIAWRLFEGMQSKIRYNETSMFFQFPIWWPYLACFVAAVIGGIVGCWSAYDRVRAVITGRDSRSISEGAVH